MAFRLNQRGNFERIMNSYKKLYREPIIDKTTKKPKKDAKGHIMYGFPEGLPRLTESDLVLIQPITAAGQNLFTYPVLDNQGTPLPEEIRLNQNDEFTACEVGIFLYGTNTQAVAGGVSHQTWTYAPIQLSQVFVTVEDFWLGNFSISVNKVTWVENWNVRKHYASCMPQHVTQNYGTATTGAEAAKIAAQEGNATGFVEMTPTVSLSGAKKYTVQIDLPYAINSTTSVATFTDQQLTANTMAINASKLEIRGFLAQNAAQFQGVKKKRA